MKDTTYQEQQDELKVVFQQPPTYPILGLIIISMAILYPILGFLLYLYFKG